MVTSGSKRGYKNEKIFLSFIFIFYSLKIEGDLTSMLEYIRKLENNKEAFAKLQKGKKQNFFNFILFYKKNLMNFSFFLQQWMMLTKTSHLVLHAHHSFKKEKKITVIRQEEEEAVQNITREERDAVETMVNLTNNRFCCRRRRK